MSSSRRHLPLIGLDAAAFVLVLISACGESSTTPPPPPPSPGELHGAVYQRLNPELPLEGALVSWGGAAALSAADGSYALDPEATGSDSLRVSLEDFASEARWVTLGTEDQQHSFALMPFDTLPPPPPLSLAVATASSCS
jgi:hypothetical protein